MNSAAWLSTNPDRTKRAEIVWHEIMRYRVPDPVAQRKLGDFVFVREGCRHLEYPFR